MNKSFAPSMQLLACIVLLAATIERDHSVFSMRLVYLSITCISLKRFVASLYLMEELRKQVTSWGFQGSQQEMDSLLAVLVSNGMSFLQNLVGINSCNELEGGEHLLHACIFL